LKIKSLAPLYVLVLSLTLQACGGSGAGIIPEPSVPDTGTTDGGTTDGTTDGGATDGTSDGGATDGGTTDGGSTDGGTTDGGATDGTSDGSTDGGTAEPASIEMIEGFGGALVDGTTFTYPAGAEVWAGFANLNVDVYPFTFDNGGSITFTAAVAAGGADTSIYFRFERLPHPDVDPSFNLDPVLIVGETELEYTVTIPAQAAGTTYSSFLMYVVDQDQSVMVKDIVVTDDLGSTGGDRGTGSTDGGSTDGSADGGTTDGGSTDGSADGGTTDGGSTDGSTDTVGVEMIEGFGGALVDGTTFTYPAGSEVWAGFANLNVDIYPFTFDNGGSITFTAAVPAGGADTSIYFRFERLPHPDVDPSFNLDPVLIVGETELEYIVTIPAQAAGTTYSSFLMYVVDQDQPVIVKDIVVVDDNGSTAGGTTGGGATDGGSTDGSADGGTTDGGTTDGGTTDGGSVDTVGVEMIEGFGGALVDGTTFTYPAGAEVWAGFANLNVDIYPFTFDNGGSITFTAAVPAGGADTSVYFRFERLPHPDVDPAFNLDPVLVVGETEMEYTVTIPAQAAGTTYSSFLMYVVDQDQPVMVKDIVVTDDNGSTAGGTTGGGATDGGSTDGSTDGGTTDGGTTDGGSVDTVGVEMIEGFGGALVDGTTFTFPTGAEVWAGFANLNVDIYPFTFDNGGSITFTAAVPNGGSDTSVYFRFERLPHPDVDPSFNLDPVVIVGEAELEYTVTIPAQDAGNTYSSFLLYVVDQDSPVMVKDIVVTDDSGSTGGVREGNGGSTDGGSVATGAEGELTTNGDFEQGDLTGWELFPVGGATVEASNTESNGGTWSGNLSVNMMQQAIFKQANMAQGEIVPGQVLNVSFDMKGSLGGDGGVVFAEFVSEKEGGGSTWEGASPILGGGPIFPTASWVSYNYTVTSGSDVSAGVTLMLKADCGPVAGCSVDAYFDNVSVVVIAP